MCVRCPSLRHASPRFTCRKLHACLGWPSGRPSSVDGVGIRLDPLASRLCTLRSRDAAQRRPVAVHHLMSCPPRRLASLSTSHCIRGMDLACTSHDRTTLVVGLALSGDKTPLRLPACPTASLPPPRLRLSRPREPR